MQPAPTNGHLTGGLLGDIGYEWMHAEFNLQGKNHYQTPLLYLGVCE